MPRKKKPSPIPVEGETLFTLEPLTVTFEGEVVRITPPLYSDLEERIESIRERAYRGIEIGRPEVIRPSEYDGFLNGPYTFSPKMFINKEEKTVTTKNGYYISHDARLIFNTAYRMSQAAPETAIKVMMLGASGNGKTTLPRVFSQAVGMDFYRMNCAKVRDPEEWFGYREAKDGSTLFIRSHFITLLEKGNLVIVLDEFNRVEPWLHNTLFPLLDDDGATVVHDQEFRIGPNVIVVATINTGYKYTGVFELDEALYNRFHLVLELNALPANEEMEVIQQRTGLNLNDARPIVKMANILRERDVVCTTRTTLTIASLMVAGMTIREAFEFTVVRRLPQEMGGNNYRKNIVDQLNSELGTPTFRIIESDVFGESNVDSKSPDTTDIWLRKDSTFSHFPNVKIIQALRAIEFPSGSISLRDANNMVNEMMAENVVPLALPIYVDIDELARKLSLLGVVVVRKL